MQEKAASEDIQKLRTAIGDIDRQVLDLVSQRMRIAQQIGEYKQAANLPVRDFRTEVEVLRRAREASLARGVDPELGESIVRLLIEGAVRTQHSAAASRDRTGDGSSRRVLVVGGAGRMGSWLSGYFLAQGHEVRIHDLPDRRLEGFDSASDVEEAAAASDVIVLSVPIGDSARMLEKVQRAAPRALIFDICSLKSPLLSTIEAGVAAGHRIASVHPMFAPGAILLSGRVLLVCDCGHAAAAREARQLFEDTALRLVDIPVGEHDRVMGVVLGLSHAVNIAFAGALAEVGIPYELLDRMSSTTFSRQIHTTSEVAAENQHLYYEIQHLNRFTPDMLAVLLRSMQQVYDAALCDNPEPFTALMEKGRRFFLRSQEPEARSQK